MQTPITHTHTYTHTHTHTEPTRVPGETIPGSGTWVGSSVLPFMEVSQVALLPSHPYLFLGAREPGGSFPGTAGEKQCFLGRVWACLGGGQPRALVLPGGFQWKEETWRVGVGVGKGLIYSAVNARVCGCDGKLWTCMNWIGGSLRGLCHISLPWSVSERVKAYCVKMLCPVPAWRPICLAPGGPQAHSAGVSTAFLPFRRQSLPKRWMGFHRHLRGEVAIRDFSVSLLGSLHGI